MTTNAESKNIDELLEEADELIARINSGAVKYMKEEHRLQFAKHTQYLQTIKSKVQSKKEKDEKAEIGSGAEGMHKAVQDIVKAMRAFTKYLS